LNETTWAVLTVGGDEIVDAERYERDRRFRPAFVGLAARRSLRVEECDAKALRWLDDQLGRTHVDVAGTHESPRRSAPLERAGS